MREESVPARFTPFSGRRIPMSADGKGYVWELSSDSSSDDDVVEVDVKDVPANFRSQNNFSNGHAGGSSGRKVQQEYLSDIEEITVVRPTSKIHPYLRGQIDKRFQATSSRIPPPAVERTDVSRLDPTKPHDVTPLGASQEPARQQPYRFGQPSTHNPDFGKERPSVRDLATNRVPQSTPAKTNPTSSRPIAPSATRTEPSYPSESTVRHEPITSRISIPRQKSSSSGLRPLERELLESCQEAESLKRKTKTSGGDADPPKKRKLGGHLGPIKIDDDGVGENIRVALHNKSAPVTESKDLFMADDDVEDNNVEMERPKPAEVPERVVVNHNNMLARMREAQRANFERLRNAAVEKKAGTSPGEKLSARTNGYEKHQGPNSEQTQVAISDSLPQTEFKAQAAVSKTKEAAGSDRTTTRPSTKDPPPKMPAHGFRKCSATSTTRPEPFENTSSSLQDSTTCGNGAVRPSMADPAPKLASIPGASKDTRAPKPSSPQLASHPTSKSAVTTRPRGDSTTAQVLPHNSNVTKRTTEEDSATRMDIDTKPPVAAFVASATNMPTGIRKISSTVALVPTSPPRAVSDEASSLFVRDATAPPSWGFENLVAPAMDVPSATKPPEFSQKAQVELSADLNVSSAVLGRKQNYNEAEQSPPAIASAVSTAIPSASESPDELAKEMPRQHRVAQKKEKKERKERQLVGSRARSQRFRDRRAKMRNEETNKVQRMVMGRVLGRTMPENDEKDKDEDIGDDDENEDEDEDHAIRGRLEAEQLEQVDAKADAGCGSADGVTSWLQSQEVAGDRAATPEVKTMGAGTTSAIKHRNDLGTGQQAACKPVKLTIPAEKADAMPIQSMPQTERVLAQGSVTAPTEPATTPLGRSVEFPTTKVLPATETQLPQSAKRAQVLQPSHEPPKSITRQLPAPATPKIRAQQEVRIRAMREHSYRNQQQGERKEIAITAPQPMPSTEPATSMRPPTTAVYQAPVASLLPPDHNRMAERSLQARLIHEQRSRPSTGFDPWSDLITSHQTGRAAVKSKPHDRTRTDDPFRPLPANINTNRRAADTGGPRTLPPVYRKTPEYAAQKQRQQAIASVNQAVRTDKEDEDWFNIAEGSGSERKALHETEDLKQCGSPIKLVARRPQHVQKPAAQDFRDNRGFMKLSRLSLNNLGGTLATILPSIPEGPSRTAHPVDSPDEEVPPAIDVSDRPATGGKTLNWEALRLYMDQTADTWETLDQEPQIESDSEHEVLTDEDKCFFAYQVQRREISQAELENDHELQDKPWLDCGPQYASSCRANKRVAKEVFRSSDPSMTAAIAKSSNLDFKTGDDGLSCATMASEAGQIQARIERRSHTRRPKATIDLNLVPRYFYWVKEKVSILGNVTTGSGKDIELFGEAPSKPVETVVDSLGIYSAPKQASQKAIARLVKQTFTSQTTRMRAREDEEKAAREEVTKEFENEIGSLEIELFRGSAKRGWKEWEVWVEKVPMTGPRNL